ncbi:low temperature requirement protein A [Microbacterium sp. cx-55]|uniref:low temperature requirement protein A n=1 Tax=unclassified Microbacterium TaxID=2609290 RepID=UPI001CBD2F17|nr:MULTISPECIES: low temperature requirement protein A [unclassified Microbacterium]MBZ4487268.1 low temperature requirement protein A [Microbacterium sp. cx-55]MCC4908615.1 low temperature requirement protein A [Microbacterium sp. cx-59]UGB35291.1 low temperature requirement protein A [Microbacterium sp. cx-55]
MQGRDAAGSGRTASPLELFYDLTFVAAFGVASSQLADDIVSGHIGTATVAFILAMTTIVWAWTNFTWFASAFDNDDWLFRLLTMVQMAGVLVLAIGLPPLFESIESGGVVDNSVMVAGYIVIRVAVATQWLRAARHDPRYRQLALTYAAFVIPTQVGWVILAVVHLTAGPALVVMALLIGVESLAPLVAERRGRAEGGVTPWNSHHLAERYSLLTIVALGETIFGTLSSATQISALEGWSFDAGAAVAAGIATSLALWWVYFLVPHGPALSARRTKVLPWAYGHVILFIAIAATGAGLHVVGYVYDEGHPVSELVAVVAVAGPVFVFMVTRCLLHGWLVSAVPRPTSLQVTALVFPVLAILLAFAGWPLWGCLLITLASPVTLIVAYEAGGWRTLDGQLATLRANHESSNGRA